MNIVGIINEEILKVMNESESVPFNKTISNVYKYGKNYDVYKYYFSIGEINYICAIYPNPYQKNYYDVSFTTITGSTFGSTKQRVGKNLDFMNSVLKTVANCIIDFINNNEVVKIIGFESDNIRESAYVRFFKNHPYFSKFNIDDSHTKSGFIEIHINKGLN